MDGWHVKLFSMHNGTFNIQDRHTKIYNMQKLLDSVTWISLHSTPNSIPLPGFYKVRCVTLRHLLRSADTETLSILCIWVGHVRSWKKHGYQMRCAWERAVRYMTEETALPVVVDPSTVRLSPLCRHLENLRLHNAFSIQPSFQSQEMSNDFRPDGNVRLSSCL